MDSGVDDRYPRTTAERATLPAAVAFARQNDLGDPPEDAYTELLPDARRSILRRFICGLLRGAPSTLPPPQIGPPNQFPDAERLQAVLDDAPVTAREVALLSFPASTVVVAAPVIARRGYDQFELAEPVRALSPGGATALTHPVDLVPLVERDGGFSDAEQARRIENEVAESVANLALARLAGRAFAAHGDDFQLADPRSVAPAADPAASFERLVLDGHPFHPAAKIRHGMSAADDLAYAPELSGRVDVRFAAVDREYALETAMDGAPSLTTQLYDAFTGLDDAVAQALPAGRDLAEYAVVPIHPWQYHNILPDRYARQREDGRVVLVDHYTVPGSPLLNLRTVAPYETDQTSDGSLPHLKLAVAVQTTNVTRTVSPNAVSNGPQIATVLRDIAQVEAFDCLGFLPERAATCYYPPGGPHPSGPAFDDARHLSGLLRMNPHAHPFVSGDAVPVPVASLFATSPATDQPLVFDFVEEAHGSVDADAIAAFIESYAETVVPDQLFLLTKYGIALETHAQNALVVFENGRPVAALARDFGGVRIFDDRLTPHGYSVDLYPGSDVDADSRQDLHWKLYYALFQNHLGALVATLARHSSVPEARCWQVIRRAATAAFDRMRNRPDVPDNRIDQDESALFADPITHKALTAMRLQGKRHEYVTSDVSNPLAE